MIVPQNNLTQALSERLGGEVRDLTAMKHGMAHRMYSARWQQSDSTETPIVIRFFYGTHAAEDARLEDSALRELARDGYPVPEMFLLVDVDVIDGAPLTIMSEIPGLPLTQVAQSKPETIPYWFDKASDLLLRLHGINWHNGYPDFIEALTPLDFAERQVRWWRAQAEKVGAAEVLTGFNWLRNSFFCTRRAAGQGLVHRDFHPDNILTDGERITGVIDWGELTIADPAVDVGWTRMILSTEATIALGDQFASDYMRRNPDVAKTLAFWEVFAACKRLTMIATVRANQSERLAMWSGAPDLPRLTAVEDAVRAFMHARLTADECD